MLERRGDDVMIGRPAAPRPPDLENHVLPVPGTVQTAAGLLRAELATAPDDWAGVPPSVAYLDPAATGPTLTVRAWRPGDRVRPLGLGGTRKVQDIFVDRKVPRALRGRIPLVDGPRGIFETAMPVETGGRMIQRAPNDPAWYRGGLYHDDMKLNVPGLWFMSWYDVSVGPNLALYNHVRKTASPAVANEQWAIIAPVADISAACRSVRMPANRSPDPTARERRPSPTSGKQSSA